MGQSGAGPVPGKECGPCPEPLAQEGSGAGPEKSKACGSQGFRAVWTVECVTEEGKEETKIKRPCCAPGSPHVRRAACVSHFTGAQTEAALGPGLPKGGAGRCRGASRSLQVQPGWTRVGTSTSQRHLPGASAELLWLRLWAGHAAQRSPQQLPASLPTRAPKKTLHMF